MKFHHIAAILLLVVLTGAGYALTVWMHGTLPHGETEHAMASETGQPGAATGTAQGTGDGANAPDPVAATAGPSEASAGASGTPDAAQETEASSEGTQDDAQATTSTGGAAKDAAASGEQSQVSSGPASVAPVETHAAPAALRADQFRLTVSADRAAEAGPRVTISLQSLGDALPLAGWRLGDPIGLAGHPDHLYYFGALTLGAGQLLTLHSGCGRDQGLTLYWCLSQPLALLDSAQQALFFVNPQGDVALTCAPEAAQGEGAMEGSALAGSALAGSARYVCR